MNNNNLLLQLEKTIKDLEIKLNKTKNLKSKLEILHDLNKFNKEYKTLLELEHQSLENKYQNIITDKIRDIDIQIEKAAKRGKFMQDYFMNLSNTVLIKDADYLDFIDKFWIDKISNLDSSIPVNTFFLIQMSDTSARTLNKMEIIKNTPDCLDNFKEIIKYNLNNIYTHYLSDDKDNMIKGFVMRYKILSSTKISETVTKKAEEIRKGKIQRTVKIKNMNYPLSTNTIKFGQYQNKVNNLTFVRNTVKDLLFEFDRSFDKQIIKIFKDNKLINTLIDYFIDLENNLFKRVSNKLSYYIKDEKIILKCKDYNPKFIKTCKEDKSFNDNIYTGDIETLTKIDDNGKRYFEPYALSYFNGFNSKNYYVTDYTNWEVMMYRFWEDLFSLKLKKYRYVLS